MDEEIWNLYDHSTGREVHLRRTDPAQYELFQIDELTATATSADLNREQLTALWIAIGKEIGEL